MSDEQKIEKRDFTEFDDIELIISKVNNDTKVNGKNKLANVGNARNLQKKIKIKRKNSLLS